MNKKKLFNFNDYYIEQKKKQIKELDYNKKKIEAEIKKQKELLEINKSDINKLKFNNAIYKDEYESLKRIFTNKGITININNNNYNIKEWDNLKLIRKDNLISIITKDEIRLKTFNKEISSVIYELIKENDYSIVVLRVEAKSIKVQFHVNQ